MAKVITTELQHSGASAANITLDSSKNVTCENNLTVDGTTTLTGAVSLPDDTVSIADLSATGTASATTFLRGDNAWAAAGGGKVLQVKHVMTATTTTPTANDTAQDLTNMSLAITPAHASNKILCIASTQYEASGSANGGFRIRNTTANQNVTTESVFQFTIGSMERQTGFIQGYDHPNSTSEQTYIVQGINWSAGSNTFIFGGNGAGITLTLIEVDLS